jgi:hypothetical protein
MELPELQARMEQMTRHLAGRRPLTPGQMTDVIAKFRAFTQEAFEAGQASQTTAGTTLDQEARGFGPDQEFPFTAGSGLNSAYSGDNQVILDEDRGSDWVPPAQSALTTEPTGKHHRTDSPVWRAMDAGFQGAAAERRDREETDRG